MSRIETRIAGIPCLIEVTHYHRVAPWKGSAYSCPSDVDWYGYEEIDWQVCDQRGRPAAWLEKKMTPEDAERIEGEVSQYMARERERDYDPT